jgi:hypothetical protein
LKNDLAHNSQKRRVMKIKVCNPALGGPELSSPKKVIESANRTQVLDFISETTEGGIKLLSRSSNR